MFDFNKIKIVKGEELEGYGSFVGIRRDKSGNLAFSLPKGFDDFEETYNNVKELFFKIYRTFKKFRHVYENKLDDISDEKPQSKDNLMKNNGFLYRFVNKENNEEVILYSKIDAIDSIIDLCKELEIATLVREIGLTEDVDYSKIDYLIDKGIYQKNNAIFIEFTLDRRNAIKDIPSDLIEMYCYIYKELAVELKVDLDVAIADISASFSAKHLSYNQSLFNENSFISTILTLKDILNKIHNLTSYKSNQYWLIYEAIEKFLYGELEANIDNNEEGFWGINNFSQVWEDMCNYYMASESKEQNILYCDTLTPINREGLIKKNYGGHSVYINKDFYNPFYIEFNDKKRWMRPDMVLENRENFSVNSKAEEFFNNGIRRRAEESHFSYIYKEVKFTLKDEYHHDTFFLGFLDRLRNNLSSQHKRISPKARFLPRTKYSFSIKNIEKEKLSLMLDNFFQKGMKPKDSNPDIYIIDWKYLSLDFFNKKSEKLVLDINKQLIYEFCLSSQKTYQEKKIRSQFGLLFYTKSQCPFSAAKETNISGIEIIYVNFYMIQEAYLDE
ncbi:hypothetical protein [uncultured Cardiobacterium sp.]|uniref:hypothetical protein n=1 Tax=uncultured Cardiobacterium sp. TaxID=417619 RepID=UPI00260B32E6|nr:hypothetical protein [uncultured Cardiobacterium sp.]